MNASRLVARASVVVLLAAAPLIAQEYKLGPDSERQAGAPRGKVTQHSWTSQIYPGTVRDYWVYVPAQYRPDRPAPLMVFQDGAGFVREDGRWRVPIVLDNLIHKGEMPPAIGVFINPGVVPAPGGNGQDRANRSFEYDALNDRYTRFLLEEILPEVGKEYNLSSDPNDRAIGGSSSGAICAFTVAWNRPDSFRRVLSFIGSYTDLRGGDIYPALIRKTEPKPLRVFLQDGNRDQNVFAGNWWIGNQAMASALVYAGYENTFVTGTEAHNSIHGSAILPEALRWLWRAYPKPITKSTRAEGARHYVNMFLDPGSDWELVGEGYRFTEGPAIDKQGNVFFTDFRGDRIHKIGPDGKVSVFKEDAHSPNGMMFGPDGRLHVCQAGQKRIIAYDSGGAESVLAQDAECNDLVVSAKGDVYFTDPNGRSVWLIPKGGEKRVAFEGIERPNGLILSPDQSELIVADSRGKFLWSFQVQADGSLVNGERFYRLETTDDSSVSGADGITMAANGYVLVATRMGIQILDPPGRVVAILNKPQPGTLANLVFAGPDLQTLYVAAGDKVFRRRMRIKGVLPWEVTKPQDAAQ